MDRKLKIIARRDFLLGAAAGTAGLALLGVPVTQAQAPEKPAAGPIDEALKKILGDAKVVDGRFTLELPEIAESGNTVPYSITVESPMLETDYVKSVHILAASNPQPGVASFAFTPASGKAQVASRMRLARTQEVVAVAEMSDGRFFLTRRLVKVTIGGCGG